MESQSFKPMKPNSYALRPDAQGNAEQQKLEHEVFERVVDRYKSLLSFKEHTISDVLRTILGEELSQKIIKEMEDK